MSFSTEQLEQLATLFAGTSINPRSGKAKTAKAKKVDGMQPISLADLKAGNPARESREEVVPETAVSVMVDGKEYHMYPAQFEGIKGIKCTFMPFKKQFLSVNTIKLLANEDIQVMISEFAKSL